MNKRFYQTLVFTLFVFCCKSYADSQPPVKQTLTIAVNNTSFPYHFKNAQGNADGVMVDMWRLWAKKQHVDVEFVVTDWPQTLTSVSENKVDIHAGMSKTRKREKLFSFTSPFFRQKSHFYIDRNYSHIENIDDLLPLTIGVVAGSSHVEQIKKINPSYILRAYPNRFALFDGALKGEVAVFSNLDKISRNYPRRQALLAQFPTYKRLLFNHSDYVSAVAKNNDQLLKFIEQGFEKISLTERTAIEKKWLGFDKKSDRLILAYTPDLAPYMDISSKGEAQGLLIDVWKLWSKQTGLPIEFIPQSMSDSVELIEQGSIDAHVAFPKSALSLQSIQEAYDVYSLSSSIFISNHLPNISQLDQLNGKSLGVFEFSPYKEQIRAQYPQIKVMAYDSFNALLKAAEQGSIDAFIASKETAKVQLTKARLNTSFYRIENSHYNVNLVALTQTNNTRLVEMFKEGFELIPIEKLLLLEQRWLSESREGYYKIKAKKIQLSQNELAFIQQHPVIKVGLMNNWQPIEFIDDDGALKGINPDVNQLVSQRTGLNFSYQFFDNWNDMLQALLNKEIDLLGSATETEERKKSLLFSQSYWDMPWVVIHQRQNSGNLKIKDFYGKELAIVKGYYLAKTLRQQHPNLNIKLVENHEEGIKAVRQGLVKGLIENIASASELIKRESLITLNMSVVDEFNIDKNSYAVRKDWPLLKSILDKAILTITEVEKQTIYERWFGISIEKGFDKDVVLRVAGQISIIIVVIIVVIIVWNRRLYVEVKTRKSLEEKMKHMATHDELTGLANRVLLKDRINTAISFHQRQSLQMAVLFIDLDGFKNINDTYGHDVGDELLIQVAQTLSGCVRKSDTIVRFGGDEFVLLLTGLHNQEEAAFIAEKVLKLMQQPFKLSLIEANIGCSIGIAMYPADGQTDTDLLKEADRLMYKVKAAGKNHYVFNNKIH
ncbi:transporter substrate-binding domain-containing protein [Colwelliaceae bacterium 6441]